MKVASLAVLVILDLVYAAATVLTQVQNVAVAIGAIASAVIGLLYLLRLCARFARRIAEMHSVLVGDEEHPSMRQFQKQVTDRLAEGDGQFDELTATIKRVDARTGALEKSLGVISDAERAGVRAAIATSERRKPDANI